MEKVKILRAGIEDLEEARKLPDYGETISEFIRIKYMKDELGKSIQAMEDCQTENNSLKAARKKDMASLKKAKKSMGLVHEELQDPFWMPLMNSSLYWMIASILSISIRLLSMISKYFKSQENTPIPLQGE